MKVKIDENKLKYVVDIPDGMNALDILKEKIEYLRYHNKNYTKHQYYDIDDLYEIIKVMEVSK